MVRFIGLVVGGDGYLYTRCNANVVTSFLLKLKLVLIVLIAIRIEVLHKAIPCLHTMPLNARKSQTPSHPNRSHSYTS